MKKFVTLTLSAMLLTGGVLIPAQAAATDDPFKEALSSEARYESSSTLPETVSQTVNGLTLAADPRSELLSIVQYMGKNRVWVLGDVYSDYRLDIDTHFRQFDQHPAVTYYDTIELSTIDETPLKVLIMNGDFTVNTEAFEALEISDYTYFDTPEKLQEFFDLLHSFYDDTGFEKFYNDHRDFYKTIIQNTADILPEENLIGYVEDFFRQKGDSYTVNLVPLFHPGGFGGETAVNGRRNIYSSIGPSTSKDHIPVFWDTPYFTELEAHEFGHSFIPIAGETNSPIAEQIKQSEYLHERVSEDMASIAYSQWHTVLEETILRACVVHMMENYDPDQAAKLLQIERDEGFLYIDSVYESIEKYLADKDKYEIFAEFLPIVMEDLMRDFPG